MVLRLRLVFLSALLLVSSSITLASASPSRVAAAVCSWQAERSHVVQVYPNPYSTWISVVYFKYYVCDGVRKNIHVRRIDQYFHTDANPPFSIKRILEWVELSTSPSSPPAWGVAPAGKYCYNACTIQATIYPAKTVSYSTGWYVAGFCEACWPATGGKYELRHFFVKGTWALGSYVT